MSRASRLMRCPVWRYRLLQQSLGGNSRTSLVVNVPPGYDVMGESHCSLLFAQRAMKVAVVAK